MKELIIVKCKHVNDIKDCIRFRYDNHHTQRCVKEFKLPNNNFSCHNFKVDWITYLFKSEHLEKI